MILNNTTRYILTLFFLFFTSHVLAVPVNGLVGEWLFNGNSNDSSGYNHHGFANGVSLSTDRFGNTNSAYYFDGNDDIRVTNSQFLTPGTGSFTMSYWINNQVTDNSFARTIYKHGSNPFAGYYTAAQKNGNVHAGYGSLYHTNSAEVSGNVALNEWQLITAVLNRHSDGITEDVIMYIGNQEVSRITTTVIENMNDNYDIFFGSHAGIGEFFVGQLDDIRMYDRALSQSEISDIFNDGIIPVTEPAGLLFLGLGLMGFYRLRRKLEG